MIKKRGPLISLIGIGMLVSSFLIMLSVMPTQNPTFGNALTTSNLLEDMFDEITPEFHLLPGNSHSFTYDVQNDETPLVWGIQIKDFNDDIQVSVSITDESNNKVKATQVSGPLSLDVLSQSSTYDFHITNNGQRQVAAVMMFSENVGRTGFLNQGTMSNIMYPVMVSGFLFILGIILVAIGAVLSLLDWKKNQDKSEYI